MRIIELGYIEKGTGKHQSNVVYDKKGLSPTIMAGFGVKMQPTMIMERVKSERNNNAKKDWRII